MPRPRVMADACGRALRRALPAIAVTCVLAAVGGGLWFGYRFITTSERFAIEDIQVHGASRLAAADIRAVMPVAVGDNVFTADLGAIGARLRAHPWIASAEARRVLPNTIVVEIREYEPAAMVALGDLYLVDASGHPFKRARLDAGDGADLPIVTGIPRADYERDPAGTARAITSAIDVVARWQADERPAVGEVHVGLHGLALHAYDTGATIELGSLAGTRDLPARMRTFDAVWAELTEAERARVTTIHLDARVDHVTVAFKD